MTEHSIIIGYGRVGRLVGEALQQRGQAFLAVETSEDILKQLKDAGIESISGNAARSNVLRATNPTAAHALVIVNSEAFEAGQIVPPTRRCTSWRARIRTPRSGI
uniref:NAD-binding protein n=1 Tax=Bradyrhizobium sp. (strain ORS 278) TaxID=114615 RepID=UPI0002E4DA56|nr:NAD-binding protein [Bradyrhizobium sp. ORS 278]